MSVGPLRTILAATDLTDAARLAVRTAADLAVAAAAGLHVFYCVSERWVSRLEGVVDPETRRERLAGGEAALEHHVRSVLGDAAATAVRAVSVGQPYSEITRRADEMEADLIVLGSHRPRAVLDGLLGATADRVVRTAKVPCLVAHKELRRSPRHVLVATDFSDTARLALDVVVTWLDQIRRGAETTGGRGETCVLELLHVHAFATPGIRPGHGRRDLEELASAARERAGPGIKIMPRLVSAPIVVDGILRVAEETEPDLVVLGTHGHGALVRTLLGGVAVALTRMTAYPILVVPPARSGA